ncbi:MAG: preprotein translocase subunit SecE [bacterium]|nr:preprotein translocase subunit SecE [bacterium]
MPKNPKLIASFIRLPQAVLRFIKESRDEIKKVSWPSRQTTVRYTIIVIGSSLALGAVTGGLDYVLTIVLERVII